MRLLHQATYCLTGFDGAHALLWFNQQRSCIISEREPFNWVNKLVIYWGHPIGINIAYPIGRPLLFWKVVMSTGIRHGYLPAGHNIVNHDILYLRVTGIPYFISGLMNAPELIL